MSSQQQPLSVPATTLPATPAPKKERPQSPEASYFSLRPHALPRSSGSASPSLIQRTDTGGSSRLTPPVLESQSRQTRTTSPSEHLSNPACFSPGVSSSGSFQSSETGHSACSYSSSEFLTPPRGQADTDNPPYKARHPSSESLTMVRKLRRANTMPHDHEHKRKRRLRKRHKCGKEKVRLFEHQNRPFWWLPSGCQIAPTAPRGQKQLCEGHAGQYTPKTTRYGNIDTYGRLLPDLRSTLAPAMLTRRWSSVEIGAHQIILESTLPLKPTSSPIKTSSSPLIDDFVPKMLSKPYRSSTFTRGAIDHDIDHDIVGTVRKRLTLRQVPGEKLHTPEFITLRRASGESPGAIGGNDAGETTPRARHHNAEQKQFSAAYLITAEDIDSITELIEENLRRNYDLHGRYDRHAYSTPPSQQTTPTASITSRIMVPSKNYLNQPATATAEVQPTSPRSRSPLNYLQVVPACKAKNDTISRADSQKSVHEVIWESGGSPRNSLTDEDDSKLSGACGSEPSTPNKVSFDVPRALRADKGDAFDPINANASISEWSERCPRNDIAVVLTSSGSDSNDVLLEGSSFNDPPKPSAAPEIRAPKAVPRARARPPLRSAFSETNVQDVVSFPPLTPRKKTIDWYSPLPPIEVEMPRRSLYDIGVDVSFGPSSSKTVTPRSSQTSWVRSNQVSPSRSIEFNPNYEIRCKISGPHSNDDSQHQDRRKSVIKVHPNAIARTGDLSAAGSALGTSSRERRQSSTPSIQRSDSAAVRVLISSSDRRQDPPSGTRVCRPGNTTAMGSTGDINVWGRNSPPPLRARPDAAPSISGHVLRSYSESSQLSNRRPSLRPRLPRVRTIDNIHKGEHEGPPSKRRAPSPCPTPRPPSPSEYASENEDTRESLPSSPDPAPATSKIRQMWADRLNLIRLRSPPLPAVDRIGIYGRMTGSQERPREDVCDGRLRSEPHVCDDCPKPSEPHVCDDCAKDPRASSIDCRCCGATHFSFQVLI
jgi:hypothetical protein